MEIIEVTTREGDKLTFTRAIKFGVVGLSPDVLAQLDRIEAQQKSTLEEVMKTKDDLDQSIAALLSAEAARDAAVLSALNDLKAQAAGTDFEDEVDKVITLTQNAAALTQTATADDPGPTTVPTTPIPPTDGSGGAGDGSAGSGASTQQ